MHILRFEVKQHVSALYGHHQVFIFIYSVTLRKKTWWWPYKAETCCFTSNLRYASFI